MSTAALQRVEQLYAGEVGDAYTRRSRGHAEGRLPFWKSIDELLEWQVDRVLEVGCGDGQNLHWWTCTHAAVGVDVNAGALQTLQARGRPFHAARASAGALPFPDHYFDLAFTCGLLIHVPEPDLPAVLDELVRVSRKWVLLVEYESAQDREIPWRGLREVLWARPFGYLLWQRHPELAPIGHGALTWMDGFDNMEWSLWEKRS